MSIWIKVTSAHCHSSLGLNMKTGMKLSHLTQLVNSKIQEKEWNPVTNPEANFDTGN